MKPGCSMPGARLARLCVLGVVWVLALGTSVPAGAVVVVTDPDDGSPFLTLFRPTSQFDETGLSGFEYLISSVTGDFRENDQYLISGNETLETTSLGTDLGVVGDLSGTTFAFSVQHNLVGGRNFTFSLTNQTTFDTTSLCWGLNCAPGASSVELLNGIPPIHDYNGIQIQVRAQDVGGSSAAVTITGLTGVIDLVREPGLAFLPEPATGALLVVGLVALVQSRLCGRVTRIG